MSHITHYEFQVSLPKGWEETKEESIELFLRETSRKSEFIDRIIESDMIKLDELTVSFDVAVSLKDNDTPKSDESLDSDFWVRVAQGEKF
jgi:hypothetical protein